MPKVVILAGERYPFFNIDRPEDDEVGIEISEFTYQRWRQVMAAFELIQAEMAELEKQQK